MRHPGKGFAFVAFRHTASRAKAHLQAAGALDGTRRVVQSGDTVVFPLKADPASLDRAAFEGLGRFEAMALPLRPPRDPVQAVRRTLADEGWTDAEIAAVPREWRLFGDVVVAKVPEGLRDEAAWAAALAEALGAKAVLHDDGVEGDLRRPRTRHVWGDTETRTVHVERGVRYAMDPAQVMFSGGNVTERGRLIETVGRDEVVVDCFAGIGYFTLPLAVHAGCTVHACELNPVSAGFLREGAVLNGVDDRVQVHEGDCREVAPSGVADRVHLGYLQGTLAFIPTAVRALKPEGGVVHVHENVYTEEGPEGLARDVIERVEACGATATVRHARRVKTFAPHVLHAVVDVEVRP